MLSNNLNEIKKIILDTLFPIECLSCQKEGAWICSSCLNKVPLIIEQNCPICEKNITPNGQTCLSCQSDLDGLLVVTDYKNKLISHSIHLFKYRFAEEIGTILGKLLVKTLQNSNLPIPDMLIPVPLHEKRLRFRGFNQSEILSNHISQNLTPGFIIPVFKNVLIRQKNTIPQMKIKNGQERKLNIQDAFALKDENSIQNKIILLVDDVSTTGSTMIECAKVLKSGGAKKVFGIVIARTR